MLSCGLFKYQSLNLSDLVDFFSPAFHSHHDNCQMKMDEVGLGGVFVLVQ
jgi:hypothetical protein